jgi:hypothetical protein
LLVYLQFQSSTLRDACLSLGHVVRVSQVTSYTHLVILSQMNVTSDHRPIIASI